MEPERAENCDVRGIDQTREIISYRTKEAEKVFEARLRQQLIDAAQIPFRVTLRTEDHSVGNAFPDICLMAPDGESVVVAIECKADAQLHSLTTAIGQTILYGYYAPVKIIAIPHAEKIPSVVKLIAAEHDILILPELNFALNIQQELKTRGLQSLQVHLANYKLTLSTKRTIVSLPYGRPN